MDIASPILLTLYAFCLSVLFLFTLVQGVLLWHASRYRKEKRLMARDIDAWPRVTVQLPLYNEYFVAERLVQEVCALDYPKELLQIQVLDDSTDETTQKLRNIVAEYVEQGFDIQHLHRTDRTGYKAGALQEAMPHVTGEFIAIFDADFIPPRDFLKRTLPYFKNERTGLVQTRWGHLNQNLNWLTRLQSLGLDGHFRVEQAGRNHGNLLMSFNGTAGVWRTAAIEDAGGWEHDTLTEDLDLSYRAQFRGWEMEYLDEVESPAELPVDMESLRSQQFRWTKGAMETGIKLLPSLLSSGVSFRKKFFGIFHLSSAFVYPLILFTGILSVPLLFIKHAQPEYAAFFKACTVFVLGFMIMAAFYGFTLKKRNADPMAALLDLITHFPAFLALSMGMSLHNSRAMWEGLKGKRTEFVRTPKTNSTGTSAGVKSRRYRSRKLPAMIWLELLLALYYFGGVITGIDKNDYGLVPFHLMLSGGFLFMAGMSIYHAYRWDHVRTSVYVFVRRLVAVRS